MLSLPPPQNRAYTFQRTRLKRLTTAMIPSSSSHVLPGGSSSERSNSDRENEDRGSSWGPIPVTLDHRECMSLPSIHGRSPAPARVAQSSKRPVPSQCRQRQGIRVPRERKQHLPASSARSRKPPLVDRQTLSGLSPRAETQSVHQAPGTLQRELRSARLDGGRKPSRSRHSPMWATVWPAATVQPAIAQIAHHPLRQVEEAVLKHVQGIDPTIKPHSPMRTSTILHSRSRCRWNRSASTRRSPVRSRSSRWTVSLGGSFMILPMPYG